MSGRLVMLRGLPAAGKTTWAEACVRRDDGRTVRVGKDALRAMLDAGRYSEERERRIRHVQHVLVAALLRLGLTVLADDTNLRPTDEERLRRLAAECGAHFETRFFPVDVEEAVRRDAARATSVGEAAVRRLAALLKTRGEVDDS